MPIKLVTTTEGGKKKFRRIYRTSQNIRMINVFLESLLSEYFHLTALGCPLTLLISGPAVRAAQILIWSFYVFLRPVSTAFRTSAFPFVSSLNDLLYILHTQNLPSWLCGFNLQLVQLIGGFGVFSLSDIAPGFQLWFYFHLWISVVHWGLLLRLPWRTWVCPSEGQGHRGSGSSRYSEELAARAAGNTVL